MLRLNVSGAFHTPWMGAAAGVLSAYLANKPTRVPELPLYANATAQPYKMTRRNFSAHRSATRCAGRRASSAWRRRAWIHSSRSARGKTLSGLIRKTIPGAAIFNVKSRKICKNFREVRAIERQNRPRHRRQPRHRPRHCLETRAGRLRRAILYAGRRDAADETVALLEKTGHRALAIQCNVADGAAAEAAVKEVEAQLGPHRGAGQQRRHRARAAWPCACPARTSAPCWTSTSPARST